MWELTSGIFLLCIWTRNLNYLKFRFVYLKVQNMAVIVPHHLALTSCHWLLWLDLGNIGRFQAG
jgi:hypothetical protein